MDLANLDRLRELVDMHEFPAAVERETRTDHLRSPHIVHIELATFAGVWKP
jgi:hypothetical protein